MKKNELTIEPPIFQGHSVRLEPLSLAHLDDLLVAVKTMDPETWRLMPVPRPDEKQTMQQLIDDALTNVITSCEWPFAIIEQKTGKAIGSTRFLDIDLNNKNLEIGWTWIGRTYQRTTINTECKLLLLAYVFEELKFIRVFLKTDERNKRSQQAILRLGAKIEGTFRRNRICWDGHLRNTVYFSILNDEWPQIKHNLMNKLKQGTKV